MSSLFSKKSILLDKPLWKVGTILRTSAKIGILVSSIGVLCDALFGYEFEGDIRDETERALTMLDLDADELLSNTPLLQTLQIVCREFSNIEINQDVLEELRKDSELSEATQ